MTLLKCVLPINIINEKIYVFLWFWFCILSALTILNLLWTFGIAFFRQARVQIIKRKLMLWYKYVLTNDCSCFANSSYSPKKDWKIDVNLVVDNLDYGDWKVLYHLLKYDETCHGTLLVHSCDVSIIHCLGTWTRWYFPSSWSTSREGCGKPYKRTRTERKRCHSLQWSRTKMSSPAKTTTTTTTTICLSCLTDTTLKLERRKRRCDCEQRPPIRHRGK